MVEILFEGKEEFSGRYYCFDSICVTTKEYIIIVDLVSCSTDSLTINSHCYCWYYKLCAICITLFLLTSFEVLQLTSKVEIHSLKFYLEGLN